MTPSTASRWRLSAGILDQALSAGAGFLASVAIARWLTAEEYGAFGVALALSAWLLTVHTALVSEPLLIFGPSRFGSSMRGYVRRLVQLHIALCALLGGGAALVVALGARGTWTAARPAMIAAALLLATTALPLLGRRLLYAVQRIELAAVASGLQLLTSAALLLLLWQRQQLTAVLAIAATSLAALVAGVAALMLAWRTAARAKPDGDDPSLQDVWRLHAGFGWWGLVSAGLAWGNTNLPAVLLPFGGTLAAVATLRAATNLMSPMLQLNAAVGVVQLSSFVRVRGTTALLPMLRTTLIGVGALSAAYWGVLLVGGDRLSIWLYDSRYPSLQPLLLVIGLLPLTEGLNFILGSALRSLERPDLAVRAQGFAFVAVTLPGALLATSRGPSWAGGTMLIASTASAIASAVVLARLLGASRLTLRTVGGEP